MPGEKKDVLEFPLEELEVPAAVRTMMLSAATAYVKDDKGNPTEDIDMERLHLMCEKLEGYFEDQLEKAKSSQDAPDEQPEEEMYPAADDSETFLNLTGDGDVYQVVHKGVVFGKLCNERVKSDPETQTTTTCIKQFGHNHPDHEDVNGDVR